ncbi:MAG: IscS subfamily cysteine desulfurase [Chitinophagaceae bacterium]|nr:IscS subfamily cysteine desulfurase [Chitinophagaceae bacterium]
MVKSPVYLDNNSTTPCDPQVVESMLPYFTENYGNSASQTHSFGWVAKEAVDHAREQVARLIGAIPEEVVFTSGATEADNLAIKGVFEAYKMKGNHIITVETEHKAVLDTCRHLEKQGASITYLKVASNGRINLEELEAAICPETVLIAVMYANNETGTLQPVQEISEIARRRRVLFFSDAAQAAGKIDLDVDRDGIDLLALSAHKMYGPKGIGALYVRRRNPRVTLISQMDGGGHERNRRSGTLNVPAIVGFGKACELAGQQIEAEQVRLGLLRNRLETSLIGLGDVYVNGSTMHRLAHVSNLSFNFVRNEVLLTSINKNVAVSSGSACTSASIEPSYVLKALGLEDNLAYSSLRFALGRFTTEEEIDYVVREVSNAVRLLREMNPELAEVMINKEI